MVRRLAAKCRSCPPAVSAVLATDPEVKVRWEAARNDKTPPPVLTVLASDPDPTVREAASENPGCPPAGKAAGGLAVVAGAAPAGAAAADAVSALVNLGYRRAEAIAAVNKAAKKLG